MARTSLQRHQPLSSLAWAGLGVLWILLALAAVRPAPRRAGAGEGGLALASFTAGADFFRQQDQVERVVPRLRLTLGGADGGGVLPTPEFSAETLAAPQRKWRWLNDGVRQELDTAARERAWTGVTWRLVERPLAPAGWSQQTQAQVGGRLGWWQEDGAKPVVLTAGGREAENLVITLALPAEKEWSRAVVPAMDEAVDWLRSRLGEVPVRVERAQNRGEVWPELAQWWNRRLAVNHSTVANVTTEP